MCTYYHILIGSNHYQLISGCERGIKCSSPRWCGTHVTCNGCDGSGCTCPFEECLGIAQHNISPGFAYNSNSNGDWCYMCTNDQLLNPKAASDTTEWGVYGIPGICKFITGLHNFIMLLSLYFQVFNLSVPFISTDGCGGGGVISASNINITSDNFPANYSNNLDCNWVVRFPEGKTVMLKFHVFNLQWGDDCE